MSEPTEQPAPPPETPTAATPLAPTPDVPTPKPPPGRFDKRPPRGNDGGGGRGGFRREKPRAETKSVPMLETRDYSKPSLRELDKDIEGELDAAMSGMSGQEIYGDLSARPPKGADGAAGGPKMGKVIRVSGADVFVHVPGGRSEGLLPVDQFPDGPPEIGTEIEVSIEGYDRANGLLILTRKGAAVHANWESVAEGMVVEGRVTGVNKGGLEVDVNGIRGFMPISQIDLYRVEDTNQYLNQRFRCVVQDVNPSERNLVLSRRTLLEKEREENREKLWAELAEGQVRDGVVRSVKEFGAFVELGGGVDGLVHVSELSWQRVNDVSKLVQVGQAVKVVILKLDRETRKLSLGMKQLQESPWDAALQKYIPSSVVQGKVTRLMEFGAFVELEPGIEGLIHISELAPSRVRRVKDFVQPDQVVQVMVLAVDPEQRRISLSLKAALPKEAPPPEEVEEEEEVEEVKPPRPRTTPLRGGVGSNWSALDELGKKLDGK